MKTESSSPVSPMQALAEVDHHRLEILNAAASAFMERGYSATSIADIADRLGATKGRIYHWYRSKNQIYLDVHRRAVLILLESVEPIALENAPAQDRLFRMVYEHAAIMIREMPYQRVSVQSLDARVMSGGNHVRWESIEDVIALRDRYEQLFADVISEGVADGSFREVRGRLATKPLLGAMNWITRWYAPEKAGRKELDEEICREIATFAVLGLRKVET
jgi:AcrR family transcriptional regulator